jgi:hypothetical protein
LPTLVALLSLWQLKNTCDDALTETRIAKASNIAFI